MKRWIVLCLSLWCATAHAQTYPSPTYQNVTVNGTAVMAGSGVGLAVTNAATIGDTLGVAGAVTLGTASVAAGQLILSASGTGRVMLQGPAHASFLNALTVPGVTDTLAVLGTAQTFTADQIFSGSGTGLSVTTGAALSGGGTLGGTFAGTPTFSGALTLSGTPSFTNGASLGTGTYSGAATFSGDITMSGAGAGLSVTNGLVVSGRIENANGSASVPTYTFANDLTTGAYLPAAGELGFAAAGALVGDYGATNAGEWTFANPVVLGGSGTGLLVTHNAVVDGTQTAQTFQTEALPFLSSGGVASVPVVADCQRLNTASFVSTANSAIISNITGGDFSSADVGKSIWIQVYGFGTVADTYIGTIASVQSATAITLNSNFPNSWSANQPALIVWGTDNTTVINTTGTTAVAYGQYQARALRFPGSSSATSGGTCAFGMGTTADINAMNLIWIGGDGAWGVFADSAGYAYQKPVVPVTVATASPPHRDIDAETMLPRMSGTLNPCVVIAGDSTMAPPPNAGFASTEAPEFYIQRQIQEDNPGKVFTFVNRAIGGQNWYGLANTPSNVSQYPSWYTNHSSSWLSYIEDACPGGATPDMVVLGISGINDQAQEDAESAQAAIQTVKTWTTAGGLAPDIVLIAGRPGSVVAGGVSSGIFNSYATPEAQANAEYAETYNYTLAKAMGLGILDFQGQATRARDGWTPRLGALDLMTNSPQQTATATFPYNFGYVTRDFNWTLFPTGRTSGSNVWSNIGTAAFQIGGRPDNLLKLSTDGSNNLTVEVDAWGGTAPSTVTTTGASGATLSSSGQSTATCTMTGVNSGPPFNNTTVTATGACFGSISGGMAVLFPQGGYGGTPFRTFAQGTPGSTVMKVYPPLPNPPSAASVTITYGGMVFIAADAVANTDVTVTGAGAAGALYVGKVTGYTSATQVTVAPLMSTGLTSSSQTVFVGRIDVPRFSTSIAAGSTACNIPDFDIAAKGSELTVVYQPCDSYAPTATVSISSSSPDLSATSAIFSADMVGLQIIVPGAGAAGGNLSSYISVVTDSEHVVLTDNASTSVSAVSETITFGAYNPAPIAYRGNITRAGGLFVPIMTTSGGSNGMVSRQTWISDLPPSILNMPGMTDLEMWGDYFSSGSTPPYPYGGSGAVHMTTLQVEQVDLPVNRAQRWGASIYRPLQQNLVHPIARAIGVNMNASTPADTALTGINETPANYLIDSVRVRNCSASASSAIGALYTATGAGGTELTTSATLANATNAANTSLTLSSGIATTEQTANTWYWHLTTAEGGAATCDVWLYGKALQ